MKPGFVYIWKDTKRKMFYIGSHMGEPFDGYTGSNRKFQSKYKNRPYTFRRKILEYHPDIKCKELLLREQLWLQQIKPEELIVKYYNEKRVAAGGNIISDMSPERKQQHREKSIAARAYGYQKWRKKHPRKDKVRIQKMSETKRTSELSLTSSKKNLLQDYKQRLTQRAQNDAFMTPLGSRPFVTKAAKELGVCYQTLRNWLDTNEPGYYWLNKDRYFYK